MTESVLNRVANARGFFSQLWKLTAPYWWCDDVGIDRPVLGVQLRIPEKWIARGLLLVEHEVLDAYARVRLQCHDGAIAEFDLKLLAKWDPKRYGDKIAHVGGGPGDAPIQYANMTREARQARIEELQRRRAERS